MRCRKGMHGYPKWACICHDLWTSVNNHNIFGSSMNITDPDMNTYTIPCCLAKHNSSYKASNVAQGLQNLFQGCLELDLDRECYSVASDTTGSAKNDAANLDANQENCELHVLTLTIKYTIGSKENTRMVTETDDVSILGCIWLFILRF